MCVSIKVLDLEDFVDGVGDVGRVEVGFVVVFCVVDTVELFRENDLNLEAFSTGA